MSGELQGLGEFAVSHDPQTLCLHQLIQPAWLVFVTFNFKDHYAAMMLMEDWCMREERFGFSASDLMIECNAQSML